jgi:hypothetical protein
LQTKPVKYRVDESPVSGEGVFAEENVERNQIVGIAFKKAEESDDPDISYLRTLLGAKVNHSDKPNLYLRKYKQYYFYVAKRNIGRGEELFIDYSTFPWEGKTDFRRDNELKELLEKIRSGKFEKQYIDPNRLYHLHDSVRREYVSPYDMGGYNWGYMTSGDIGAGHEESPP